VCVLSSFLYSLELRCAGSLDYGGVLEYKSIRPMRPMYAYLYSYPSRVSQINRDIISNRGGGKRSQKMTGGAHSNRSGDTKGWGRSAPLEGSGASLHAGVFWCLPDSSSVVFIAGKFHLFMQLNPPFICFL
jgi:hypothetical protein